MIGLRSDTVEAPVISTVVDGEDSVESLEETVVGTGTFGTLTDVEVDRTLEANRDVEESAASVVVVIPDSNSKPVVDVTTKLEDKELATETAELTVYDVVVTLSGSDAVRAPDRLSEDETLSSLTPGTVMAAVTDVAELAIVELAATGASETGALALAAPNRLEELERLFEEDNALSNVSDTAVAAVAEVVEGATIKFGVVTTPTTALLVTGSASVVEELAESPKEETASPLMLGVVVAMVAGVVDVATVKLDFSPASTTRVPPLGSVETLSELVKLLEDRSVPSVAVAAAAEVDELSAIKLVVGAESRNGVLALVSIEVGEKLGTSSGEALVIDVVTEAVLAIDKLSVTVVGIGGVSTMGATVGEAGDSVEELETPSREETVPSPGSDTDVTAASRDAELVVIKTDAEAAFTTRVGMYVVSNVLDGVMPMPIVEGSSEVDAVLILLETSVVGSISSVEDAVVEASVVDDMKVGVDKPLASSTSLMDIGLGSVINGLVASTDVSLLDALSCAEEILGIAETVGNDPGRTGETVTEAI